MNGVKSIRHNRRALEVIEMALLLPVVLLALMGALEYALQFHVLHRMTDAARDAARCLAVKEGTTSQATTLALNELADLHTSFTVATVVPPQGAASPDVVVTITVPRKAVSLGVFELDTSGVIKTTVTMRKEGQ